jgi:NTP pyrophosphatase (non-canonical NTP hydrolase)
MQEGKKPFQMTIVCSNLGNTEKDIRAGRCEGSWHPDWVGVIRMIEPNMPEPPVVTKIINDLCKTIHEKNVAAGWWDAADNPLVVPTKLMLIVSELAEAMEGDRKSIPDTHLTHRSMLSVELADAIIRIADLAGFLNIQLGTIIAEKEAYNASRADHKPENRKAVGGKKY